MTANEIEIRELINDEGLARKLTDRGLGMVPQDVAAVIRAVGEKRDVVTICSDANYLQPQLVSLSNLMNSASNPKEQVLIVVPHFRVAESVARFLNQLGVQAASVSKGGGTAKKLQGVRFVTGTTSDVLEAIGKGTIDGERFLHIVIADPSEQVLRGALEELIHLLPDLGSLQVLLHTRELSPAIQNFSNKFLKSPEQVILNASESGADQVEESAEGEESAPEAAEAAPEVPDEPAAPPAPAIQIGHSTVDVGGDLLAKQNAIADIIESEGLPSSIIFCNQPSDTELVEVVLRKRGIRCRKLIGFVPPHKLESAITEFRAGTCTALVLTDISVRGVDVGDAQLVFQHGVAPSSDIYLARTRTTNPAAKLKESVTLLAPLDVTLFPPLKKAIEGEFVSRTLPAPEKLLEVRLQNLARTAEERLPVVEERLAALSKAVLGSPAVERIVAYLLHSTLEVLPSLQQSDRGGRDGDSRGRFGRDRGERGERGDRNDRGGRGRGGRGRRDFDDAHGAEGGADAGYEQRGPREERQRAPYVPPQRDVRLYIGHGTREAFSHERIVELATTQGSLNADQIRRTKVRDLYSFVDVPEELAESVIEKLSAVQLDSGSKLLIKKAVQISLPREEKAPAPDQGGEPRTEPVSDSAPVAEAVGESELVG